MKKPAGRHERRKRKAGVATRTLVWAAVIASIVVIIYAVSQNAGVAYTDRDIGVVDFSALTSGERLNALRSANRARCTCGCGMNLAQCVATDMTCPVREQNIQSIRRMVQEADR
jgi:hypothetical protein